MTFRKIITVILIFVLAYLLPFATIFMGTYQLIAKPYQSIEYLEGNKAYSAFGEKIRDSWKTIQYDYPVELDVTAEIADAVQSVHEAAVDRILTDAFLTEKLRQLQQNVWDFVTGKSDKVEPVEISKLATALKEEIESATFTGMPVLDAKLKNMLREALVNQLPTEITLTDIIDRDQAQINDLKSMYNGFQILIWVSSMLMLVLLIIVTGLSLQFANRHIWLFSTFITTGFSHLPYVIMLLIVGAIIPKPDPTYFDFDAELGVLAKDMLLDVGLAVGAVSVLLIVLGIASLFLRKRTVAN